MPAQIAGDVDPGKDLVLQHFPQPRWIAVDLDLKERRAALEEKPQRLRRRRSEHDHGIERRLPSRRPRRSDRHPLSIPYDLRRNRLRPRPRLIQHHSRECLRRVPSQLQPLPLHFAESRAPGGPHVPVVHPRRRILGAAGGHADMGCTGEVLGSGHERKENGKKDNESPNALHGPLWDSPSDA